MRKMMMVSLVALAAAFVTHVAASNNAKTTKQVMVEGHKGTPPLCGKAKSGKATKEEIATLVSLYTDMASNKPSKGDADEWKKKCDALLTATKGLEKDPTDKAALKAYATAVDCGGCHKTFK